MLSRRQVLSGLLLALTVASGACKRPDSSAAREDKLVIFAAASLRDVFTAMGDDFKRSHPGVELRFAPSRG